MEKVLWENKKYRVLLYVAPKGHVIPFDFVAGHTMRVTLDINQCAKLQKRFWFFGWSWSNEWITNRCSVVDGWTKKYGGSPNVTKK